MANFQDRRKKKKGKRREKNKGYFFVLSLILFITFSKIKFNLYANKLLLLLQMSRFI